MVNPKILITAGCSFTQVPGDNWPVFLRDKLDMQAFFDGAGSAGNDTISRRVVFRVNQCLTVQKYRPENLLVGVMWSGVSRKAVYLSNEPVDYYRWDNHNSRHWYYTQPCSVGAENNYYLMHPGYHDQLSQTFYRNYFDDVGLYINTIENILRVQWLLKLHNIKYFFTTYNKDSLDSEPYKQYNDHPDVKYLRDQIDYNNVLPISNMYDWGLEQGFQFDHTAHPTPAISEAFVDRVILPHLKSKGHIS